MSSALSWIWSLLSVTIIRLNSSNQAWLVRLARFSPSRLVLERMLVIGTLRPDLVSTLGDLRSTRDANLSDKDSDIEGATLESELTEVGDQSRKPGVERVLFGRHVTKGSAEAPQKRTRVASKESACEQKETQGYRLSQ